VRILAHAPGSDVMVGDIDKDGKYTTQSLALQGSDDRNIIDRRLAEADPVHEAKATWTGAFVRGDVFYNEEEHEEMRSGLSALYREKEWQALEIKRQMRLRQETFTAHKPADKDMESGEAWTGSNKAPPVKLQRTDNGIPFDVAVPDLTTPELEKLRSEFDALDWERATLRKELGLTDLGDVREGRPPILPDDPHRGLFQPPPTSKRWKPQCWQESWGVGHEKTTTGATSVFSEKTPRTA
jgi:hypothetical protein